MHAKRSDLGHYLLLTILQSRQLEPMGASSTYRGQHYLKKIWPSAINRHHCLTVRTSLVRNSSIRRNNWRSNSSHSTNLPRGLENECENYSNNNSLGRTTTLWPLQQHCLVAIPYALDARIHLLDIFLNQVTLQFQEISAFPLAVAHWKQ